MGRSGITPRPVAAVLNPHLPTTMIWAEGTRQVLILIERQAMHDHLSAQLGAPALRPLTFSGGFDLRSGAGAALRRLVLFLVAAADAGRSPIGAGSVTEVALRWGAGVSGGLRKCIGRGSGCRRAIRCGRRGARAVRIDPGVVL